MKFFIITHLIVWLLTAANAIFHVAGWAGFDAIKSMIPVILVGTFFYSLPASLLIGLTAFYIKTKIKKLKKRRKKKKK